MATLGFNTYGKTRVRLTYVDRTTPQHQVRELSVSILLQGDFEAAYKDGDNSAILPTDTMKNTVYVVAKRLQWNSIEALGKGLAQHFLHLLPQLTRALINIDQVPWLRIENHSSAFHQSGNERRTVQVEAGRSSLNIISGIKGLQILKTADSGFSGFLKDELTTLPETDDRLFGTVLEADWNYSDPDASYNLLHQTIRSVLLNSFSEHHSLSVQHTMFAMGQAVLDSIEAVAEIHMVMPNKHCILVDLSRFGLRNENEVFVPIDEPSGYIEARIVR